MLAMFPHQSGRRQRSGRREPTACSSPQDRPCANQNAISRFCAPVSTGETHRSGRGPSSAGFPEEGYRLAQSADRLLLRLQGRLQNLTCWYEAVPAVDPSRIDASARESRQAHSTFRPDHYGNPANSHSDYVPVIISEHYYSHVCILSTVTNEIELRYIVGSALDNNTCEVIRIWIRPI
jgi:hypothetical protein